jgi:phage FluMu gp28-like protein
MVADRSIPTFTFEAPEGFEVWSEQMRTDEIAKWNLDNLLPELKKLNPNHHHCFGEDFARKGDLTVFCPLAIAPDLRKRVPFVVELRNVTFNQQREVLFFILDRLPRRGGAAFDATGNGAYLAEQAALKYGAGVVDQVQLNTGWYAEWMPKLKAEFEQPNIELPRHQNILNDLMHIKVEAGIPKIDKGRQKDLESISGSAKRHGDFAVALAMAIRASWMQTGEIDWTALPKNARGFDNINNDDNDFQLEPAAW